MSISVKRLMLLQEQEADVSACLHASSLRSRFKLITDIFEMDIVRCEEITY